MRTLPTKASRHRGIEASCSPIAKSRSTRLPRLVASHRRAFSLIEVLLAIFILGVGVISIAALFPAGIAQQRQSNDDISGPIVADNAMAIIRSKIRADDFGTYEEFGTPALPVFAPRYTIPGDWTWLRPGFIFADDPATNAVNETGAIDIFSGTNAFTGSGSIEYATEWDGGYTNTVPLLKGIPWNKQAFGNVPPRFLFTRQERYYPMMSQYGALDQGRPQYVWDCMFRRFQGKILVAIFVYRVTVPGGGNALYSVAQNGPGMSHHVPPLPIWMDLTLPMSAPYFADGPWTTDGPDNDYTTVNDNAIVRGNASGIPLDVEVGPQGWEEPRQWILDQNNNVHRVLAVSRQNDALAKPVDVELTRPLPGVPPLSVMYVPPAPPNPPRSVISDIWYLPLRDYETDGTTTRFTLTPVYVTVKEL